MQKNELVEKTINLYKNLGWKSLFVKLRFWDAPFVEVEKLVPKEGLILDLGSGEGIFTNYLGICSSKRKIIGVELDHERIKQAKQGIKNVTFLYADVTKYEIPEAHCIIMFHLLHHLLSYSDQERVIKKCLRKLVSKGKLIIVEVEPSFSYKFFLAWFTDHFIVPWLFERKFYSPIFFRTGKEWVSLFEGNGFSCRIIKADKGKPFSHVILLCLKK